MSTKDPQQQGGKKVDKPDQHGHNLEREDETTKSSAGYEPKPQMEGFGGLKQSEGSKNRKRTTSSQREQGVKEKSNTKERGGATTKDLSAGSTDRREEARTQAIKDDGWDPLVERERHKEPDDEADSSKVLSSEEQPKAMTSEDSEGSSKEEKTTAKGGTAWTIPVANLTGEEDPELLADQGPKKRLTAAKTKILEKALTKTKTFEKEAVRTSDDSFFEADGESSIDEVISEEEKQRRHDKEQEEERHRQQKLKDAEEVERTMKEFEKIRQKREAEEKLKEEDRSSKRSAKKTGSIDAEVAEKMMEENKVLKEQMLQVFKLMAEGQQNMKEQMEKAQELQQQQYQMETERRDQKEQQEREQRDEEWQEKQRKRNLEETEPEKVNVSGSFHFPKLLGPTEKEDPAERYGDWFTRIEISVAELSSTSASWWVEIVTEASQAYHKYLEATIIDRLSIKPSKEAVSYTHLTLPTIYSV